MFFISLTLRTVKLMGEYPTGRPIGNLFGKTPNLNVTLSSTVNAKNTDLIMTKISS